MQTLNRKMWMDISHHYCLKKWGQDPVSPPKCAHGCKVRPKTSC